MSSLFLLLGLVLTLVAGGRLGAAAQEVPSPSLCQGAPRSPAFFEQFLGTPASSEPPATPAASPTPFVLPAGEPADAESIAAITATIHQVIACRNAGDILRVDALYTDDYFIRQAAANGPPSHSFLESLAATPVPVDGLDQAAIYTVRDVRVLPDGRVGALVDLLIPPEQVTFFIIFVKDQDRWLIDDEIVLTVQLAPPSTENTPLV